MKNINGLLKNANLYSIEYSGIFNFKFTLSSKSLLKNYYDFCNIELISECNIFHNNKKIQQIQELYSLINNKLNKIDLNNKHFFIKLENNHEIQSIIEKVDNINDRFWVITFYNIDFFSTNNNAYILNDFYKTYFSPNLSKLLK